MYSQNRRETTCANCGRFIGSWEKCPFCRHFNPKRWPVRLIKYSMPVLTVLGLVLLGFMGRKYGVQEVKITDLTRKSNYAQVRLAGWVSDDIRFHISDRKMPSAEGETTGSLEFELDDGTDRIRVRAYDDVCAEVQAAGKVPGFGDRVELVGSYQYKARRHFLILGAPRDLKIARESPANATPLAWLQNPAERGLKLGQRVRVTGRIGNVKAGPYDLSLWLEAPDGAALAAPVSASLLEAYGQGDPGVQFLRGLRAGDYVTVSGGLSQSKGRTRSWRVSPAAPGDVAAADEATWRADNGN